MTKYQDFYVIQKEHDKMAKKVIEILKNDKMAQKLGVSAKSKVKNSNDIDNLIKKILIFTRR